MAYFSEIAKKAINAAHGEKMTDWEGHKSSDNHDTYSRDNYMPIEDENTRRTYRARGGEIPELQSKRGGHLRHHRADGGADEHRRGGHVRHHRSEGGEAEHRRGGHVRHHRADGGAEKECHGGSVRKHHEDGGEAAKRHGGHVRRHHEDGGEAEKRRGGAMSRPRDMFAEQGKGVFKPERGVTHCSRK